MPPTDFPIDWTAPLACDAAVDADDWDPFEPVVVAAALEPVVDVVSVDGTVVVAGFFMNMYKPIMTMTIAMIVMMVVFFIYGHSTTNSTIFSLGRGCKGGICGISSVYRLA